MGIGLCLYTGIRVPVVFVMRAVLLADELLVHDFFELDHFGDLICVYEKEGGWCNRGCGRWLVMLVGAVLLGQKVA